MRHGGLEKFTKRKIHRAEAQEVSRMKEKVVRILEATKPILQLEIIPRKWLTILSGVAAILTGAGALICGYSGVCETTLTENQALELLIGGAAIVGIGRRGQ